MVPPGSNTQGGSWKFSDVPTIEHKQISPSPEKPMPRIIMPDVGVRCRTINYDEVLDVQEALDQRRNLSVREQLQNRSSATMTRAWRKKTSYRREASTSNQQRLHGHCVLLGVLLAFLASHRWRGG